MAAALIAPLGFMFDQPYAFIGMALFMAVLIFIRHKDNIKRLMDGTEPKIGKKKTEGQA
jgi:glycerol-3-phosphate acyltransferase PlsY